MHDISNISDIQSINFSEPANSSWINSTLATIKGYRVTPVFENGKTLKRTANENYLNSDVWNNPKVNKIGVILDSVILLDYDGNKHSDIITLSELEAILGVEDLNKSLVQHNTNNNSLHFLFRLPDEFDRSLLKHSTIGWLKGIDVLTGNSILHLKEHKILVDGELPAPHELVEAPKVLIDSLKKPEGINKPKLENIKSKVSVSDINECKKILSYINPDVGYDDWLNVILGVTNKLNFDDACYILIDEWSSKGNKYTNYDDIKYKIDYHSNKTNTGDEITFATVCNIAKKYGAPIKKIKREFNEEYANEFYGSFEKCLESFKDATKDSDKAKAYEAALNFIASEDNDFIVSSQINELKTISGIGKTAINKSVKKIKDLAEEDELTHNQMAEILATKGGDDFSCSSGEFWHFNEKESVWTPTPASKFTGIVADTFDGQKLCRTQGAYDAITKHTYNKYEDPEFFKNAPIGVATPTTFISIKDSEIEYDELSREHRATFKTPVEPVEGNAPLFIGMLQSAFGKTFDQQSKHLQQLTGLALLGASHRYQSAVFLKGVGGSGKSTFLRVLEALVPKSAICSISPVDFGSEQMRVVLANKRFNIVGELDKDKFLPDGEFKKITGGDMVTARNVYERPFEFYCTASHWFNGNHYINCKDTSSAFWRRWDIVHFIHKAQTEDRDLASKIIENELGQILHWAIEGAKEVLLNGGVISKSDEHHRCLAEWSKAGNSATEWLNSDDNEQTVRGSNVLIEVTKDDNDFTASSAIYEHYTNWCRFNNRVPMSANKFYSELENNGLQRHKRSVNGFKGIKSSIAPMKTLASQLTPEKQPTA